MAALSHLKLKFNEAGSQMEFWYGLSETVIQALATWENSLSIPPDALEIAKWLDKNGGVIDRDDGPAYTTWRDNGMSEMYYTNGQLNRGSDMPAVTIRMSGIETIRQEWWENGRLTRKGGKPAVVEAGPEATLEEYFVDGKRFRDNDLPNLVIKGKDGRREEQWLDIHNTVLKKANKPGLMKIPGVTLVA